VLFAPSVLYVSSLVTPWGNALPSGDVYDVVCASNFANLLLIVSSWTFVILSLVLFLFDIYKNNPTITIIIPANTNIIIIRVELLSSSLELLSCDIAGDTVGFTVGLPVGILLGMLVGVWVGYSDGNVVGFCDGFLVGFNVDTLGICVGGPVGFILGLPVGVLVGILLGIFVGLLLG